MRQPSRRALLRAGSVSALTVATLPPAPALPSSAALAAPSHDTPSSGHRRQAIAELEEFVHTSMETYGIPGVAVGILCGGTEYVRGFGVTDVEHPAPVDADTLFRVGSTTKTFTATALMRLRERGLLALDAPVRAYLPEFRVSDPSASARVTVRQLLNHTAGWLGDHFQDTGEGQDALHRYVEAMADLPQLTRPGEVFSYNNAAFGVAGRLVEVLTGRPYDAALAELVLDPLDLTHSRIATEEPTDLTAAVSHTFLDGEPVVDPSAYRLWRSLHPAGGLVSSVRDQLRYARFHLGEGRVPDGGPRLLGRRALRAMRSRPGPGGTLFVELDGVGVAWMLRPSAQGPRIVQHGGNWPGQHSGFLLVPERGFALTVLTNSESGTALLDTLFTDDWALRRFAGVSNLPAVPRSLDAAELAAFEGVYTQSSVDPSGDTQTYQFELVASQGQLLGSLDGVPALRLAFYAPDHVLLLGPDGTATPTRADFLRDAAGRVSWLRLGGRLARHEVSVPSGAAGASTPSGGPRPDPLRPWLAARAS